MTILEELTKEMGLNKLTKRNEKKIIKTLEKNLRCPPWNDEYEDGCKKFTSCESCWLAYLNSEAK